MPSFNLMHLHRGIQPRMPCTDGDSKLYMTLSLIYITSYHSSRMYGINIVINECLQRPLNFKRSSLHYLYRCRYGTLLHH